MDWTNHKVLVTGGASFIGSHLVDALLERGASVRVADDLTSGKLANIREHVRKKRIEFRKADLREPGVARKAVKGIDTVFHLAAAHGGRGYVDLHQAEPATNLFLDGLVFWEAHRAGAERIVFASSGCVYPNFLQSDTAQEIYLAEDLVAPPYDADNLYGWAKLMGELALKAFHREYGMKTASCRYFTVYGPRGVENHAVIAMIARSFIRQDPFQVWGDGTQVRNWTFIEDIVRGTILAAEKISDGTAVNLGTMERIRVIEAVKMVMGLSGHTAEIAFQKDMPTGPLNRVADNSLAKKLLGWEPRVLFREGLKRTFDWYIATHGRAAVRKGFEKKLVER